MPRQKGTPNIRSIKNATVSTQIKKEQLPIDFLLAVLWGEPVLSKEEEVIYDENGVHIGTDIVERKVYPSVEDRIAIAKHLTPYFSPRLSFLIQDK